MPISKDKIIQELLKQCPEFQRDWDAHVEWMKKIGKVGDYEVDALRIIGSLLQAYQEGRTDSFPRFFEFIERLVTCGDDEVRNVAVDGYLQRLQFSLLGRKCGPDLFAPWMQPETKRLWYELWHNPRSKEIAPKIAELSVKRIEHLREYKVHLTQCAPDEKAVPTESIGTGMGTKLGGNPDWVQNDDRPRCNFCKRPMTFVAQIDSIEHYCPSNPNSRRHAKDGQQWMFGDVGMIYVFFCFYCQTTQSVFQCG